MRIGVFTLHTPDWQPLADVTGPVLRRYCARHEYELIADCRSQVADLGMWKTLVAAALLPLFDALWVVDVDVLVTNEETRIESFIDEEHTLFVCHDSNYGLNAGSYIIRRRPNGVPFLNYVLAAEIEPGECEQDAMRKTLKRPTFSESFCKVLPHPSINSYMYELYGEKKSHSEGQWESGDMCLHLPGTTLEKRIQIFSQLL